MRSIVLVETLPHLPGLLTKSGFEALAVADTIWVRDAETHPAVSYLALVDVRLATLEPAEPQPSDRELTAPGTPTSRRLARALFGAAADGPATFLLEPDDDDLVRSVGAIAAKEGGSVEVVATHPRPAGLELLGAVQTIARLRDPKDGCPWDLEQDHQSLATYAVEEAWELVDAIAGGDDNDIRGEIGDVLLQVLLHAQVAADRQAFNIDSAARALTEKLVRRHPHVFADGDAETAEEVEQAWQKIKQDEKSSDHADDEISILDGIPDSLGSLQRAAKVARRLPATDTRPDEPATVATALVESLEARDRAAVGQHLFALVQVATAAGIDLELALREATNNAAVTHST